ncbi:MAG TPA: N-6 DNA methylase, partial [Ktedonobacterales bacterium]
MPTTTTSPTAQAAPPRASAAASQRAPFTTVRTEGALIPADLLTRIAAGGPDLDGLTPEDYHLYGERINEATNRAWNRAVGAWEAFKAARAGWPAGDPGTTGTRERWLLPLFQELGYGRLQAARAVERDGQSYPISHLWGAHVPIHLVGAGVDLDRRTPGVAGAARVSPHGLVQGLLSGSDGAYLWGFVSNGTRLRILRDSARLSRPAYVEFDLDAMMEGEAYADFVLLWLLCHESRVEGERPAECWLERWVRAAERQGTRALDQLRDGVRRAIEALGSGFLAHPANAELRARLRAGELDAQEYYRQLLRVVYRLLFLFAAEDRDLLLDPTAAPAARARYAAYYSTRRLRHLAGRLRGGRHGDLHAMLRLVVRGLGDDRGCPDLGLPALGGFLFATGPASATPALDECALANQDLLDAVRALAFVTDRSTRRVVDYKNLGAEELGSVYEALLELRPELNVDANHFTLAAARGNERKTTGSYYTPTGLVAELITSALDPVLEAAARSPDPERAILRLRVCDPASGSGHFLLAAAHRMARWLAQVRTRDDEPAPPALRAALRDVIAHCVYGVDVNPMAVELCKVSLWMEAVEPGKPLNFLDHHVKCGNSLLGVTRTLLADGLPDDAFDPVTGDDKTVARELKRRNSRERDNLTLPFPADAPRLGNLADDYRRLTAMPEDTPAEIHAKQREYERLASAENYDNARLYADAWCAAYFWPLDGAHTAHAPTHGELRRIEQSPWSVSAYLKDEARRIAGEQRFFHWHLEYPDVFDGTVGEGFDCVLGNPPWERIKLQEEEFFASRAPHIASAPNAAARKRLIAALPGTDPALHAAFVSAQHAAEAQSKFFRAAGRYPLTAHGDINVYSIFAENNRGRIAPSGRAGIIVPTGIATDDTNKAFFGDVVAKCALASLYDFENRDGIFPGVHRSYKFSLLTLTGDAHGPERADLVCFALQPEDLLEPERHFTLSPADFALINPNTRTLPIFRSRRDAELTRQMYRAAPVLVDETGAEPVSPWGVRFATLFHMSN